MYIQKVGLNTFYRPNVPPQKSDVSVKSTQQKDSLVSGCCYRPIFANSVNFKGAFYLGKVANESADALQGSLKTLLTPIKKDFLLMKKGAVVDCFNKFHDVEFGEMMMVVKPEMKFLFKNFTDVDLRGQQFSVRVVDLDKREFDFAYLDDKKEVQRFKLKGEHFYSLENGENPLSEKEVSKLGLDKKFINFVPILQKGLEKVDDILNATFSTDSKGYSLFLARGIKKRMDAITKSLNAIEPEKRYTIKRSYTNYIQFPNKATFFLKENDKMFASRYAFIPHREGEEKVFRIVKFDSDAKMQDAFLIDLDDGIFKTYCQSQNFNIYNTNYLPKNKTKMNSDEIASTQVISMLEKYYELIDEFGKYVDKNNTKSTRMLLNNSDAKDYIAFNKIKQNFVDRLKYVLPNGEKELEFMGRDGDKYSLIKFEQEGINIIKVTRSSDKRDFSVFIDEDNCKIINMLSSGKILKDEKGQTKYISHSSDKFKLKSKVLHSFIKEAFELPKCSKDDNLVSQFADLKKEFTSVSQGWYGACSNKKTEARKLYGESFIAARGDVGGLRFAVPEKDYAIGFKPHQTGKEKFMRLTVYDKNGEIVDNFLIDEYSKVVDNYCAQGNFSKDAISRVPRNIVYKTDEQLAKSKFPQYLSEYLTELKRFGSFFDEYLGKSSKMVEKS